MTRAPVWTYITLSDKPYEYRPLMVINTAIWWMDILPSHVIIVPFVLLKMFVFLFIPLMLQIAVDNKISLYLCAKRCDSLCTQCPSRATREYQWPSTVSFQIIPLSVLMKDFRH